MTDLQFETSLKTFFVHVVATTTAVFLFISE